MALGSLHGEAEKRLGQVNKDISTLKEGALTLNAKVAILAPEPTSYLDIRNRFVATYCRDVVDNPLDRDRNKIPISLHLQSCYENELYAADQGQAAHE